MYLGSLDGATWRRGVGWIQAVGAGIRRPSALRISWGSGGQGWIHGSRAVLLVVEGAVGVKGVVGGELRGGGGFGQDWGFGLWWLSIEAKSGGGRTCRRWGRRLPAVGGWLGEHQRDGLRLPGCLVEPRGSFYRRPRPQDCRPKVVAPQLGAGSCPVSP